MKLSILRPKFRVVLILACLATPATAQFEPMFNPVQMANDQLNSHLIFRPVRDAATRPDPDVVKNESTPQADVSLLSFTPSQSRRRVNFAAFIDRARKSDPNSTSATPQFAMSPSAIDRLDQLISSQEFGVNNVADAYAFWWVVAWHAMHKRPLKQNNQSIAFVKQQASNALLSASRMASANDAQKQDIAEALLLQGLMIGSQIDMAVGHPAQQEALATAVNQGAQQIGLDLTKMNLTEKGFVPR